MKKLLLFVCFISIQSNLIAQYTFEHYNKTANNIEVIENGKKLKQPFIGGLKLPQFSECDLDLDGKNDLVVFDKDRGRISTFLNKGNANEINYVYAPEFIKFFPKIDNWLYMTDYNMDGKFDIFTSHPSGIKVYKNISNPTEGLKFVKVIDYILLKFGSITTNLPSQPADIPAIVDLDNDGDIDILNFITPIDSDGPNVYWFKNQGKELFNSSDSLEFVISKMCWGRFRESNNTCNIQINFPHEICSTGGKEIPDVINNLYSGRHEGGTLSVADVTGDGIVDALIGDPTCSNINMLVNGATNTEAIMINKVENFPSSRPIMLNYFPAVYHIDVNNDGLKDLIATPNSYAGADNMKQVQLYINNGTIGLNRYDFLTDDFLYNEMIDVGDGSSPVFVDYNNDGLQDMLISNYNYSYNGLITTGIALYQNIGSNVAPQYELITRDWQNLSSYNIASMAPCFGDMDNDGDKDMVCGANDGTLHYFKNIASIGSSMQLQYIANYFSNIDVGSNSSPSLYDFNSDGKLEIILGRKFYDFYLYENSGTIDIPNYVLITDSLYKINLKNYLAYPSGRGQLHIVQIRANENPRVVISNGNGKMYILDEVNSDFTKNMNIATDSIDLYAGYFSDFTGGFNFSMADLNGDAKPEIVVGTPQGGIFLYKNTSLSVGVNNYKSENSIQVFPNPANTFINIKTTNNERIYDVKLMDVNGRILKESDASNNHSQLELEGISAGIYFIKIQTDNNLVTKKISINK